MSQKNYLNFFHRKKLFPKRWVPSVLVVGWTWGQAEAARPRRDTAQQGPYVEEDRP